jgi:hypothetical protein
MENKSNKCKIIDNAQDPVVKPALKGLNSIIKL